MPIESTFATHDAERGTPSPRGLTANPYACVSTSRHPTMRLPRFSCALSLAYTPSPNDAQRAIGFASSNRRYADHICYSSTLLMKTKRSDPGGSHEPAPYGICAYRRGGVQVGWKVSIRRRGAVFNRQFAASAWGGLDEAFRAAIALRDEINRAHPFLTRRERCATLSSKNRSGVPGVSRVLCGTGEYWKATVCIDGHTKARWFSVRKYGDDGAFERAVEARRRLLSQVEGTMARHPQARQVAPADTMDCDEVVRQPTGRNRAPNPYALRKREILGVHLTRVKTTSTDGTVTVTPYWTAVMEEQKGRPVRRYFSIARYGEDDAKRLAIEQRRAWEAQRGRDKRNALGR